MMVVFLKFHILCFRILTVSVIQNPHHLACEAIR